MGVDDERTRILGIRHHGSGSARAVRAALDTYNPSVVLIEGPPEANDLVQWVGRGLTPPVAVLSYEVDNPARSAWWPFAVFSPEWQALSWAVENSCEVRFIDLPAAISLALPDDEPQHADGPESQDTPAAAGLGSAQEEAADPIRDDPIAVLSRAAGYDDPERWWEDAVESLAAEDTFDALTEAMAELRESAPPARSESYRQSEEQREAHMRRELRAALRIHDRVAIVCGAWHAPALRLPLPSAAADQRTLKGLPKVKVSTTWVPWTHSRLSYASGYGAGIVSPGWYKHLFVSTDSVTERWFTAVAGVLRRHDLPISSAHAIEATRLAESLAVLRGRPRPGLEEVQDAALSVMCAGSALTLEFVTRDLVVGEELGSVPEDAPLVPLDADLRRQAKSLRLPLSATAKEITLDLRKDTDRSKSRLLHRLRILGIEWGKPSHTSGTGTFKEGWVLEWVPDFAIGIILASSFGTTVLSAATARLATEPGTLAEVTNRIEHALLAELPDALPRLLAHLDERAAHEADIANLLSALPALVRARRYGTVRGTDTEALGTVAEALLARAAAGLPAAVGGLSPEAAADLRVPIDQVTTVVGLLGDDARQVWFDALGRVLERRDVPGLLAGRLTRTLRDAGVLSLADASGALSRALSRGATVHERASFAEGFLDASALLLIHDTTILSIVDNWVASLDSESFLEVLPVLRRAFGAFNRPERASIARQASQLDRQPVAAANDSDDLPYADMADALSTVGSLLRETQ